MKVGWQLKEELPLFLIVLVLVYAVIWYFNPDLGPSATFGTAFLIAAIVTSLEVIIHAWQRRK